MLLLRVNSIVVYGYHTTTTTTTDIVYDQQHPNNILQYIIYAGRDTDRY